MSSRASFLVSSVLAGSLAATASAAAAHAADLSVCIDKASAASRIDRTLAEAVAAEEGRALVVHPFDTSDADEGLSPRMFVSLATHACQLVMGYPVDPSGGDVPEGLAVTRPYERSGFVMVTPAASEAHDLASLPKGARVSVTLLTMPNLYILHHPELKADVHETEDKTIAAVVDGKAAAAMVWRGTWASYMQAHAGAPLKQHQLTEPHAQWNIVALYAPAAAADAAAFNQAVQALEEEHKLGPIVEPFASLPAPDGRKAQNIAPTPAQPGANTPGPVRRLAAAALGSPARALRALLLPAPAYADTPPALYSADQASAGATLYASNCAMCHGKDLTGMAGPALKGKNFAPARANYHVRDIFTIVSQNMPATAPGSLAHDDYVKIMAFLMQQNGYPAGATPLTFDGATASTAPFVYQGQ